MKGKDSKFSPAKSATPVTVLFGMVSLYIEAEGPAAAAAKKYKNIKELKTNEVSILSGLSLILSRPKFALKYKLHW